MWKKKAFLGWRLRCRPNTGASCSSGVFGSIGTRASEICVPSSLWPRSCVALSIVEVLGATASRLPTKCEAARTQCEAGRAQCERYGWDQKYNRYFFKNH